MASQWVITTQRPGRRVDPSGNIERVMEVFFRTVSGIEDSVEIPLSSYDPEIVRAVISERARLIEEIQTLQE